MLAAAAGAAGWLASRLVLRAWLGLVPGGLPRTDGIEVGGVAVLFAFALAVLVATATGLVPALSSARVNLSAYLRDGRTHGPAARRGSRLLVVTQVAVAVVVVAAAALLGRSLLRCSRQAAGSPPTGCSWCRWRCRSTRTARAASIS